MKTSRFVFVLFSIFLVSQVCSARTAIGNDAEDTPENVVRELYDRVTFGPGTTPDWDAVKQLFLPQATIILRTTRESTSVFDLDGFVADFVSFIERANVEETGFSEKIIKLHSNLFGDMAFIMVLYEASIPGRENPPQQGVDYFLLSKREDGWKIVAVTNDIPALGFPLPENLR